MYHNGYYTHLLPDDKPLWTRWLDKHLQNIETLEMDIRVGKGRPVSTSYPTNIQKMAIDLSQKRIDAIAHLRDQIWLIEITRKAGIKAVGQMIVYKKLYIDKYNPDKPVRCLLVAERLDSDISTVLADNNIGWELLPG